jgi:large subunit ribosomal protein L17
MRHGRTINHLGRTAPHRKAMLSNMASSLIIHKRITTTVAKAKALRMYVEPLITKAKDDSTHSRRTVFSYLKNKESVRELFGPVAEKIANRPGGYTRILKMMNRKGDNAEMAIMELVDFNEAMLNEKASKGKGAAKRTRRGKKAADKVEAKAEGTEEKAPKTPKAKKEDKAEDTEK